MRILAILCVLVLVAYESFSQTNVEANSTKEAEVNAQAPEAKREGKSQTRKVFKIVGEIQQVQGKSATAETKKEVRYDAKGGIIVPEARKGIRLSPPASPKKSGTGMRNTTKGETPSKATTGTTSRETVKDTRDKRNPDRD